MLRIISLSLIVVGFFFSWLAMLMDTAAIAAASTAATTVTAASFAGLSWVSIGVMIIGFLLGRLPTLLTHRSTTVVHEDIVNQVADFCDIDIRDIEESPVCSLDSEGVEQIRSLQMSIVEVIARLPKPASLAGAEAFRAYNKAQREMMSPIVTIARIARREAFDAHVEYRRALRGTVGFPTLQCTPSCRDMAQVISLRHLGLTH